MLLLDTEGRIVDFNPYMQNLSGCRLEEVKGKDWFATFLPERDRDRIRKLFRKAVGNIQTKGKVNVIVSKSGREIAVEWHDKTLKDAEGNVTGVLSVGQDVTERRRIEAELRQYRTNLKNLSARLQESREQQLSQVAREIHDDLAQSLSALKIDLHFLLEKSADSDAVFHEKLESAMALLDRTIATARNLCAELRPSMLDDLGLVPALTWWGRQFQDRTGIDCTVEASPQEIDVPGDVATALFRICQEALTNTARHAAAGRAGVSLEAGREGLVMTIEDNGRGITEEQLKNPRSLGILGMRERIDALNGKISFAGAPEQGTRIAISLPEGRVRPVDLGRNRPPPRE